MEVKDNIMLPRFVAASLVSVSALTSPLTFAESSVNYNYIELAPSSMRLDLTSAGADVYDSIGLAFGLSFDISDSTYLRMGYQKYDIDEVDVSATQYEGVIGFHQAMAKNIDLFGEIGMSAVDLEVANVEADGTNFLLGLGIRAMPTEQFELEAAAHALANGDGGYSYTVGSRFYGENELEGASVGLSLYKEKDTGDSFIAALELRFGF